MADTFDLNACHCSTIVYWQVELDVEHCSFDDDASELCSSNKLVVDYTDSCVDVAAFDDAFGDLQSEVAVVAVPCDDKCFVVDWVIEAVVSWSLVWDSQAIVDDALLCDVDDRHACYYHQSDA